MTLAVGTNSCSNCSRFGASCWFVWVTPVTLPPGRLRLGTRPSCTGSPPNSKTIGTVVVAALAARAGGVLVAANHSHLMMHQISHHRRQLINSALRPAVFDRHVTAIDVTGFAQPFEKGRQLSLLRVTLGGIGVEKPYYRHCRLLRAHRKRPRGC